MQMMPGAERRADGLRQLFNLLSIYNELVALKRLSVTLRRRCVFLESTQSLLKSQNAMLMEMLVGRTPTDDSRPRQRDTSGPSSTTKSTKRRASKKQQPAADGGKAPAAVAAAGDGAPNGHRVLRYQGSGGLHQSSRNRAPNDDAPPPGKLHHRSMSVGSIVGLSLGVASASALRRQSGVDGTPPADRRKRSGKLQEKWQQVKKVFATAKGDAGAPTAPGTGKAKPSTQSEKSAGKTSIAAASKKSVRSASTTEESAATEESAVAPAGVGEQAPPQLQLLSVQQPQSRSVSPRTPSTVDGADSSSCRFPSNTGSSSIGCDVADRTLAGNN